MVDSSGGVVSPWARPSHDSDGARIPGLGLGGGERLLAYGDDDYAGGSTETSMKTYVAISLR